MQNYQQEQNLWGLVSCNNIGKSSLPLQTISYSILLCDGIAQISSTQQYRNTTNSFLQTQYRFHLNPKSCLHKFGATFGEKRIEGVVKERQEARKEYTAALDEGRVVAYGERDRQDVDAITIMIGNIDPGIGVKIELTYIEELRLSLNTFYRFDLFTKWWPSANHQGFQSGFSLKVRSTRKITTHLSKTHPLHLIHQNDAGTSLDFQLYNPTLNKDFSFIYTTDHFQLPSFVFGRNYMNSTIMVSFIPKFCQMSLADAQKAAIDQGDVDVEMYTVRGEYIFLLDRSGSMQGNRIENAKRALIIFLKSLPIDSYFNVMSFGSGSKAMFENSVRLGNQAIQDALGRIEAMSADMGGTEILKPLQTILSGQIIQSYPRQIFLLTDGQISNTNSVIQLVKKHATKSRVHAIGIGQGASRYLIEECAEKGRGMGVMIKDSENPAGKIIQLLKQSLSPAITHVSLEVENDLIESIVPNPETIPFIFKGEIVNFFITFKRHIQEPMRISFGYKDPCSNITYKADAIIQPNSEYFSSIDKMAHFKLIRTLQDLQGSQTNIGDSIFLAKPIQPKTAVIDISLKHQILSKYTSFISTEKKLLDGRYQEVRDKGKVKFNADLDLKYAAIQKEARIAARFSPKAYSIASNNLRTYMLNIPSSSSGGKGIFSGHGKVGTCRTAQKRHARAQIEGITKSDIRRLARKGGVKRISSFVYDDARQILKNFLEEMLKRSITFCEYSRRRTVSGLDVVQALRTMNRPLYLSPAIPDRGTKIGKLDRVINPNQNLQSNVHSNLITTQPKSQSNVVHNKPSAQQKPIPNSKSIKKSRDQNLVEQITKHQKIEGYWDNLSLIKNIVDSSVIQGIKNQTQSEVIVTILILHWLLKYCPDPQYVLIIKKTQRWLEKHANSEYYNKKYAQFVK